MPAPWTWSRKHPVAQRDALRVSEVPHVDTDALVDGILADAGTLKELVRSSKNAPLKQLIRAFVDDIAVDPVHRVATCTFYNFPQTNGIRQLREESDLRI